MLLQSDLGRFVSEMFSSRVVGFLLIKDGKKIEIIIRSEPTKMLQVIFSPRNMIPRVDAERGLNTESNPALSGVIYFCPRGCKVKPKPLHIKARARIALHSVVFCGRRMSSQMNAPANAKRDMNRS